MWHPDWSIKDGPLGERATVDHVVPRARGGTNFHTNLKIVCHRCNQAKGSHLNEAYFVTQAGQRLLVDKAD